ncbi:MAG TPA: hypothetical protein VK698_07795 [Kofleriaceae bacterium]|nr:hypothetical protein [Kofleriaceae bacterium]
MSIRSVIMTLVLITLVALLLVGRMRRHGPPRGVRRHRTSSLVHRIEKTARAFDRLERRELGRLYTAGHPAPQGISPRAS